ncbi:MAG: glutamate-5-semialdehyde dehydrogenase [Ruminococcus sp.]|jgi:glutamate-5-semialdehyde dehydrogenase|nr:glutamate-5-semialdehyde dehydrogenase [Ruminococcus sp.]
MDSVNLINSLGKAAKSAAKTIAIADTNTKNSALEAIAEALIENEKSLLEANEKDLSKADENGISESLKDRLRLTSERITGIAESIRDVIRLDDPIGKIDGGSIRPNGMKIEKIRVPLGVIGIIYESRPNVTADAAVLCLKSGNVCILRGGKEAYNSNKKIAEIMRQALKSVGLPEDIICFVDDISRESSGAMMKCNEYIDVLIPRGGAGLINAVVKNATVPVIETGVGNCHLYVDETADFSMAVNLAFNAKCRRPSVCNAIETLLVNEKIADEFLPIMKAKFDEKNVEIRGDETAKNILGECVKIATENDYETEFLDYIIAVKVVKDVDEAIKHIDKYSSKHSECIVTNNLANAEKFRREVDSAAVYVNVSTAFTDGGMFGLGAEIGISTQKMHARGPMGLDALTTVKYLIDGNGQIRS